MASKKSSNILFFERFKGKISKIDKEGHLGVARKTEVPIKKNRKSLKSLSQNMKKNIMKMQGQKNKSVVNTMSMMKKKIVAHHPSQKEISMRENPYIKKGISMTPNLSRKFGKGKIS